MVDQYDEQKNLPDLDSDTLNIEEFNPSGPIDDRGHSTLTASLLNEDRTYTPDPQLVAKGWERRFITDPSRSQEVVDLYTEMGYEVRIVPLTPAELGEECSDCQLVACNLFFTVYTRKLAG